MNGKPQAEWVAAGWRRYNCDGLENKNVALVVAGTFSVAFCTVCSEILIRYTNEAEADTFTLNEKTYTGLVAIIGPKISAYHQAVLVAGALCAQGRVAPKDSRPVQSIPLLAAAYGALLQAAHEFTEEYKRYCMPKTS